MSTWDIAAENAALDCYDYTARAVVVPQVMHAQPKWCCHVHLKGGG